MAVLTPRGDIMTDLKIADQTFVLQRREEYSRSAFGTIYAAQLGQPIWKASFTTAPMPHESVFELEAKLDSLDGSMRFFYAGDLRRTEPIKMRGVPFTDGGTITATTQGKIISASGVDPNLKLTRGDYVCFDYGAKPYRFLARVQNASINATATGVLNGLEVTPSLPPISVVGATLKFKKPEALFVLDGPDAIKQSTSNGIFNVISFSAVQAF